MNISELAAIKEKMEGTVAIRSGKTPAQKERIHVLICGGTGCTSSNSVKISDLMKEELVKAGIADEVKVVLTGCFGLCALGPIMIVYPEGVFYSAVKVEDVPEIVSEHLVKGNVVERLLYTDEITGEHVHSLMETRFYKSQKRVALRNCGAIDPENIEEYIAKDGYAALCKAITEMTPQEVIDTMKESGLRGRGGGGFPTGTNGSLPQTAFPTRNTLFVTATRATPARLWTVPSSWATPMR